PVDAPPFVPYAGPFIAMLMGEHLLLDLNIKAADLNHRNFEEARQLVETKGADYLEKAVAKLKQALGLLYGKKAVSLQQLAATFRRGDLFEYLDLGELLPDLPDMEED